ncbi:hypothetical protein J2I47_21830 [Fibrella sp. HMF5335]|uniref:Uncharacterized protein n=1 Tax=Fibrella rubiginis TaxID=2817060 RepID=A0A939GLW2_9BACT|nr:hypothetical protein [Fibrella rubiginis]MBO0939210.1 hypothetical protein [Fibrella rubiginis]
MNPAPSPTHPEQDMIGQQRPLPTQPNSGQTYPTNPYWKQSPQPSTPLLPVPPQPELATTPDAPLFDPHLIGALVSALQDAGEQQRTELVQRLTNWLPQLSDQLIPTVEACLEKLVPKLVKVEQPGQSLLRLVRYLTAGVVLAGLAMGGLFYGWLQAAHERDRFAAGYWQHRYVAAKATLDGSPILRKLLAEADTLAESPSFQHELNRLEGILDTRRQRYLLQQREQELLASPKRSKN